MARTFCIVIHRASSVTMRMLTLQLRELERDGLVHREVPPRVEYSLTPLGRRLEPLLQEMVRWGEAYLEEAGRAALEARG